MLMESEELKEVVGNNTESWGESVLSSQIFPFKSQMIYTTSVSKNRVYMQNMEKETHIYNPNL